MNIHFHEPPAAQKVGGLEPAIACLRGYLEMHGESVATNLKANGSREADVLHFHGLWQSQFLKTSRRCRTLGIPYVVSPHGMLEPWAWRHKLWKKLPYYYAFERGHLMGAEAVLATSEQEAENLTRFVPRQKVATIPLGLPGDHRPDYAAARQKLGWPQDELVFLFLSRIHPKKGLHLLLQALCSLAAELPEKWRLVIVGDGAVHYTKQCKEIVNKHPSVQSRIEWKGAIWGDAKWDYCQAADIFCLPSFSENFGLAILEACQVGTRVLTTPYTPWSFLEQHGGAFLVEPEVRSVAVGLVRFLKSPRWTEQQRGTLSSFVSRKFSWDTVGPQYVELYRRCISAQTLRKAA